MIIYLQKDDTVRLRFCDHLDKRIFNSNEFYQIPNLFYLFQLVCASATRNIHNLLKLNAKSIYIDLESRSIVLYVCTMHERHSIFLRILVTTYDNAAVFTQEQIDNLFTRFIELVTPYNTINAFWGTRESAFGNVWIITDQLGM